MTGGPRLAIVLSGFPRRSETFALADVNALVDRGMVAAVFATKHGEEAAVQPAAARLLPRVRYLSPGTAAAQASEAASALAGSRLDGVHAYFAHTPAAVAVELSCLLGVRFGFSAHAGDARKLPRQELHARARLSTCVVACNADVASEFDGSGVPVQVAHHGVDLDRFAYRSQSPDGICRLLAVGRLVAKKGFDVLLDAVAALAGPWRLRIVGSGPEQQRLEHQVRELRLAERVTFCGPLTHDALPLEYQHADVVVVPSVRDRTGDRDGLPNVVLEAMACGAAVIAADVGAIGSAVRDGSTGLLVPSGDAGALARRLACLMRDPALRACLATRARAAVQRRFDTRRCTARFASVLEQAYG
ncbi:MAG TPA: glycosyltransferase [Vicinamibacterales bacterium]|nr:glycosyltransferase [Vicinamibacterales bacterium]